MAGLLDAPAYAAEIVDQIMAVTPERQRIEIAQALGAASIAASVRLAGKEDTVALFARLLVELNGD